MGTACPCRIDLASVVKKLLMDETSAGVIEAAALLLVVVALARRRIRHPYAVEKMETTTTKWMPCWHGCANKAIVSPMNPALSTSWCRRALTGFGKLTVFSDRCAIAILKCKCVQITG